MQALDNFISPFPSFVGDIPIPAVLVLAQPPGDEPASDPSVRASASALKTWGDKWKVTTNPLLRRKP
jgi:hypothetical protein